ncbi:MAG TPA: hypothetical protein DGH68_10345 [Bacteroidetes bacterium]|nr:hypothetical protein [Bacteroidota bacterium]
MITRIEKSSALLSLLLLQVAHTQVLQPGEPGPGDEFSDAIEDNSFFIEEAYNQGPGVVQHIFSGTFFGPPQKEVILGFTQEWPVGSQDHQFSFTVPYYLLNSNTFSGIGDVLVNYRYQLCSSDDWAALAPRVSIVLPTGSFGKVLGRGVVGAQVNLPASKRLAEHLVAHANVGATMMPGVKATNAAGAEVKRTLTFINVGGSVIVLVSANLNIMLEAVENFLGEIGTTGDIEGTTVTILSPGMRYAIDVDQLQIVPGIAVPIVFSEGARRAGMFLYLSFEHPF